MFAPDGHPPAMQLHDRFDNIEPESRTPGIFLPGGLYPEITIEYLRKNLGINPTAGIAHINVD
jgi:hypothetical protein